MCHCDAYHCLTIATMRDLDFEERLCALQEALRVNVLREKV